MAAKAQNCHNPTCIDFLTIHSNVALGSFRMMFSNRCSAWGIVGCMCLLGCGDTSQQAWVSGEVKINQQPVETGSISFIPANGQSAVTGGEIKGGKYRTAAPLGESKVEIRVPRKIGSKKLYDTPESPVQDIFEEVLPPKYNQQTELRFTASPGNQEKNWEITHP
jgi:hypothetical protein